MSAHLRLVDDNGELLTPGCESCTELAGKLAAACPFCTIMFDSGTKTLEGAENFGIEDVSELLLRSVE